ncbi:hypothetical protein CHH49_16610 [Terribacillus saccharophilus]|uniref:YqiA/YcfP family alpha/beta fold hydrolase n=1 Tax=Terribacillus saccharophilus TaxID=361277 RepID=UPI000BA7427C|nr:YqiA/YcfP family alpha/beta fold hydrolase [Terribacillus saccharophilus]PAF20398.1 hypothetical protein CHH49_16610 [Terribacillus saccharophilus]
MGNRLTDFEAGFISEESYVNDKKEFTIQSSDKLITWNTVDIIEDKDTGLYGYVLENPETKEIVISFRGTELDKGLSESIKDLDEDLNGVVFGDSDYTDVYEETVPYTGSRAQTQSLYVGSAKYDMTEQTVTYTNKNQFSEAKTAVKKYVEKYGAENITFTGHSLGGGLAQYCAVMYDSNAVTFAAADSYGLLDEDKQKRVLEGDYKDKIITYAYPSDAVAMFHDKTIGSLYYMEDPAGKDGLGDQMADMLGSHGIKNYTDASLYNEDGYYKSDLLFDEKLRAAISTSPLFLKNSGVSDFHIVIQTELMKSYAAQVEASEDLIAKTKKEMMQFLDDYLSAMEYAKSKFKGQVGSGRYDKLNGSDVDDIYRDLTVTGPKGVPMLFEMDYFDEVIQFLKDAQSDTGEIAHNMNKMAKDFAHIDEMLAGWLRF